MNKNQLKNKIRASVYSKKTVNRTAVKMSDNMGVVKKTLNGEKINKKS